VAQSCLHLITTENVLSGARNFRSQSTGYPVSHNFVVNFWHISLYVTAEVRPTPPPKILNRMYEVASSMRVIRKTKNRKDYNGLYACQTGIMTDIASLQGLWQDLNDSELRVSYILTRRINQDPTENLFSVIRGVGGTHAHPNAVEAKQRLKLTTLSWNFGNIKSAPVEVEMNSSFVSANLLKSLMQYKSRADETQPSQLTLHENCEMTEDISDHNWKEHLKALIVQEVCEFGGSEYVAGYVASKLKNKYSDLILNWESAEQRVPQSWVQTISKGGLTVPSYQLLNLCRKLNLHFEDFHDMYGDKWGLNREKGILKGFTRTMVQMYGDVLSKLVELFVRTRFYIRLRWVNTKLVNLRKSNVKKVKQFRSSVVPNIVESSDDCESEVDDSEELLDI
jgi:hypothetical protein